MICFPQITFGKLQDIKLSLLHHQVPGPSGCWNMKTKQILDVKELMEGEINIPLPCPAVHPWVVCPSR